MRKNLDACATMAMVGLCMMWGLQQVVFKAASPDLAPLMAVAIRSTGAALLVWVYSRYVARDAWISGLGRRAGWAVALAFGLEFLFLSEGLRWTSASHTSVFLYTAPLFVALGLHILVPEERLTRFQAAGLLLAFFGVAAAFIVPTVAGLSTTNATAMPSERWLWGDAMVLCAGLCFASITIIVRSTELSEAPPAQTLFYQLLGGGVFAFPVAYFTDQLSVQETPLAWASIAYQTLGVAFFSYLAWFALLRRYAANRLNVLSFLSPLFGVFFGHILLKERLDPAFVAGATLVLIGVVMVNGRDWWARRRLVGERPPSELIR